jgi:hypothetical protein
MSEMRGRDHRSGRASPDIIVIPTERLDDDFFHQVDEKRDALNVGSTMARE